ncbi:MAG TPA: cytochrome b5 domain-containing protein [Candidatus Humimicrobiaceae bacterium]
MKEFTKEELKEYDGREGRKAFVACEEDIYDVTDSFLWKDGEHQVTHSAGKDLTDELDEAPHGIDFLKRFPVVGRLKK